MKQQHEIFSAEDGAGIFVYHWLPEATITRGVVHITHGLAEHAGRYERLAEALTARGYFVYAHDHRGHGRTARTPDKLGYFAAHDGWRHVVRDLIALCEAEQRRHADLPLILFGHSMGTIAAQAALYQAPDLFDAVAMSGANGKVDALVHLGRVAAWIERLRLGGHGASEMLNKLSLDAFNKAFAPNRTAFDWLSRDEAEVDRYIADPHCGFAASTQAWINLLGGIVQNAKPENRARVRRDLPIYLFSGGEDMVNDHGRGCVELATAYKQCGLKNVSYKIYPHARHETLNELNREQVTGDLLDWFDAVTHSRK